MSSTTIMKFFATAITALSLASAAILAPLVTANPNDKAIADFPFAGNSSTTGFVAFTVGDGGQVNVQADFSKLPLSESTYTYLIRDQPVAWRAATCDAAALMFDPYGAGDFDCNPESDAGACAVGDLSGKHGSFATTCFQQHFVDPYLSFEPSSPAYIIGRSLVIYQDGEPLACATIKYAAQIAAEEAQAVKEANQVAESTDETVETAEEAEWPPAVTETSTDETLVEDSVQALPTIQTADNSEPTVDATKEAAYTAGSTTAIEATVLLAVESFEQGTTVAISEKNGAGATSLGFVAGGVAMLMMFV